MKRVLGQSSWDLHVNPNYVCALYNSDTFVGNDGATDNIPSFVQTLVSLLRKLCNQRCRCRKLVATCVGGRSHIVYQLGGVFLANADNGDWRVRQIPSIADEEEVGVWETPVF